MKRHHDMNRFSRRDFLKMSAAGFAGLSVGGASLLTSSAAQARADEDTFRFAIIADTHIIDEFYTGDEWQIYHSANRLAAVRDVFNAMNPAIELAINVGDVIHNYPSTDYDFYFENYTRFDRYKELADGFNMPIHPCLGNHDYDIGTIDRGFTHDLVKAKWGLDPYYSTDYKGWKFIAANNFLGDTQDPSSGSYNEMLASFGETQLQWLEAELQQGKPTIIYFHYPLMLIKPNEVADLGMVSLLRQYRETIKLVVAGHLHMWLQFGEMYGPPHYVCASTRYDKTAFMIFDVDTRLQTMRVANWDKILWGTYNTTESEGRR
ncbi:MAG TPA: metallophosphoesterase [bacterium]|nr:metallophosphoesterase [bacterium]